jgi:hypothetical protein
VPTLAEFEKEEIAFASRDDQQTTLAEELGFTRV